jgi:hypothetical protein
MNSYRPHKINSGLMYGPVSIDFVIVKVVSKG